MPFEVCAIHQPNFFPWLGYFDKIRRSDVFVFLDNVSYPRSGSGGMGSWVNRALLTIGGKPRWAGCPLRRFPLGTLIADVMIDESQPWREKLLRTLDGNYRKAARFDQTMTLLEPLILHGDSRLAAFNMTAIRAIADHLQVESRYVVHSQLGVEDLKSTALLVALTQTVGATAYMPGGGAGGYQEDDLFSEAGVDLHYQNFRPAPYGPAASFTPGLSVIDYLMHDGRPLTEAFPDVSV